MDKLLIVVDMQNDFIDGSLGTNEAVAIVPRVVEKIKNHQGRILCTLDTHSKEYLNTTEGKNLPVEHCIKPTQGWELNDQLKEVLSNREYKILEKGTFGTKDICKAVLSDDGQLPDQIELIGLCTDICVVSNGLLLKTEYPDTPITVDGNCCAGVTKDLHEAALKVMKSCQIQVIE